MGIKDIKGINKYNIKNIILCMIIGIVIIGLTIWLFPFFISLRDENIRNEFISSVRSKGLWGFIIMFLLQIIQVIIAIIPGEVIELIYGILYGTIGGFLFCSFGIVISSIIVFKAVKRYGRKFVKKIFSENKIDKFRFLTNYSFKDKAPIPKSQHLKRLSLIVFIVFLIPGTPKDLLTYVVALSDMSMKRFLALSTLARIPSIISSTYIGANLAEGNFTGALIVFVVVGIIGIIGVLFNDKILSMFRKK